jgi:hypothetical protein
VVPGHRARERLGREEVGGRHVGGKVTADGGGEGEIVDPHEPPLEAVDLGAGGRQRALAAVQEQPVAGAEHPEELAEDPRPFGVELERALAIWKSRGANVAVLEIGRHLARAEGRAGGPQIERFAGQQRVAQLAPAVKDQEERQQRARHGHQWVAPAGSRDVRKLIDDARRGTCGAIGLGRIGHGFRGSAGA